MAAPLPPATDCNDLETSRVVSWEAVASPRVLTASEDVSVIVCGYSEDRWNDLVRAIESVRSQRVAPLEIVVVIDHNQRLLARAHACLHGVLVVENGEQRGLSGARNTGVAVARGDVVAFLDDDAVAAPDWLDRLAAAYTDADVLGVGGPVEPAWNSGRPRWFPEEFDWVVGCTFRGMPEETTAVHSLIGCNMSFRRDIMSVVGGFRSDMGRVGTVPLAGEETEFCIRAGHHWPQRRWVYEPRARVEHTVPPARARPGYFRSRCYAEGLSKAVIAQSVGAQDGLAGARSYTFKALPLAMVRGLTDAMFHHDSMGVARSAVVLVGFTITTTGYLRALLGRRLSKRIPQDVHLPS